MERAIRLIALDYALAEAKAAVREVGGWNAGPQVELYQRADTLPGELYAWCQSFQNAMWRLATGGRIVANDIVGGEMLLGGTASVGFAVAEARKLGLIVDRPYRGDHFAMHLDGNTWWADHTGQIVKVLSLGPLGYLCQTVEGNTGSGSIDEGDGVYVRTRFLSKSKTVFYRVPGTRVVRQAVAPAILRKRRGFFAWVCWRLGEGDWKDYGKAVASVRPDVPKTISPLWWARLVTFLSNRKG